MDTTTTASTAAAPAIPAQPTTAPAPVTQVVPVVPALDIKKSSDIVNASPEALSSRYNLAADPPADEPPAVEPVAPAEPVVEPPAIEAAPVITQPITPFQFYDDQGELEIPANVKIGFKAGGKDYKDLTIDQVVRMAQQAPLADKHRQEADQYKPLAEQAQQIATAYQTLQQEFERNNALYEQILSNPTLYQEAATQFARENSPEQRLARLQAERQAERTQFQQQFQQVQLQQTIAAAANYTASRIAPSVDRLATQYPEVESDLVMAKFHELTAPLMAAGPNGQAWVPPNRLPELETSVLPQLEAWAKAKADKARASTQAQAHVAQAQKHEAQLNAQLAKRQLARPLTPLGTAPAPDVPKPKPIKSSGDAIDAILAKAKSQITQGAA